MSEFKAIYLDGYYTDVPKFSEGLLPVKIDGKYGFIDETGKLVIKPNFAWAGTFSEGFAQVTIDMSGKRNYINKNGVFVSKQHFDDVGKFVNGMAFVGINDKFGYINTLGNIVIAPKYLISPYDGATDFNEDGYAIVTTSNSSNNLRNEQGWKYAYVVIDKKGTEIIKVTAQIVFLSGKLLIVSNSDNGRYSVNILTKKIIVDNNAPKWGSFNPSKNGRYSVYNTTRDTNDKDQKCGVYIKEDGKLLPAIFKSVSVYNASFYATSDYNSYYIYDYNMKQLYGPARYISYGNVDTEETTHYVCENMERKRGVINQFGQILIPFEFRDVGVEIGLYLCKTNEHIVVYNSDLKYLKTYPAITEKNVIIEELGYKPSPYLNKDKTLIIFKESGKEGVKDNKGIIIIEPIYDKIWNPNSELLFGARIKDTIYFFTRDGQIITPEGRVENKNNTIKTISKIEEREELLALFKDYPVSRNKIIEHINLGKNINFSFNENSAVLTPASKSLILKDFELMKLFVKNGTNLYEGYPLLELTVWEDYTYEQVKFLVENGADVNAGPFSPGFTPFINCCWDNNIYITSYLVSKGVDIQKTNRSGLNGLHNAISSTFFNPKYVAYLLRIGVNPYVKDKDGWDIAYVSMKKGHPQEITNKLREFLEGRTDIETLIKFMEDYPAPNKSVKEKVKILFEMWAFTVRKITSNIDSYITKKMGITFLTDELYEYKNTNNRISFQKSLDYFNDKMLEKSMQSLVNFPSSSLNFFRIELMGKILLELKLVDEAELIEKYMIMINHLVDNKCDANLELFQKAINNLKFL